MADPSTLFLTEDTRFLIGVIADAETTIGFLLAGVGEVSGPNKNTNFLMVEKGTPSTKVELFFTDLYNRKNIGVILIGEDLYSTISQVIAQAPKKIPIVLKIPTRSSIHKQLEARTIKRQIRT